MIAWVVIALCAAYVALFVTLRLLPGPRRPLSIARPTVRAEVTPWGRHLHIEVSEHATLEEVATVFLAADLILAKAGR